MKQALFAIKDAHKRGGYGDPTVDAFRVWLLINALDRRAARKPRRLGVTPGMLKWIGSQLVVGKESSGETRVNSTMLRAALLTAWFFMMRASEYCESGPLNKEMILRGVDVKLTRDGEESNQQRLSCWFGLLVWVFLINLYFDQRKKRKTLINLKNHQ